MRGRDESPPLEQPKSSLSGGDYVVIVKEVKSTVQARYTTTYIVYEGMFVRHKHMTYPNRAILGMSHSK